MLGYFRTRFEIFMKKYYNELYGYSYPLGFPIQPIWLIRFLYFGFCLWLLLTLRPVGIGLLGAYFAFKLGQVIWLRVDNFVAWLYARSTQKDEDKVVAYYVTDSPEKPLALTVQEGGN